MKNNFNPLVSIVIPVYNGEEYIKEAIESALNQTYKNIEIIVVNDGSTDNSEKVILGFKDKVRYFKKENGGVATALNLAIKKAKGEYISWLSHDDLYYPYKIEKQINEFNKFNKAARRNTIIFSHFDVLDTFRNIRFEAELLDNFTPDEPLYTYNMLDIFFSSKLSGCTLLFPKNLFEEIGYFNPEHRTIQDYHLFMLFFKAGVKYHYIPDLCVTARHHKGQDTNKLYSVHYKELNYLYRWAFDFFKNEFQKMPLWQFEHFLNIMKIRTLDRVYAYILSEWANGDWNKDKPILWMYWENKRSSVTPDAIRLCWKTVVNQNKNDFQIKILTEDDVLTYLPNINPDYKLFEVIAHRADYIRFNLLYEYGGIWLDSDTICFRNFNDVKDKLKKNDFICTSYKHQSGREFPIISFLAAKPKNKVSSNIISAIDKLLKNKVKKGFQPQWDTIGWLLADEIGKDNKIYSYPISFFYPKNVESEKGKLNIESSTENLNEMLIKTNRYCFGQSLAYSLRSNKFKSQNESELLSNPGLIGDMFALGFNYIRRKKHSNKIKSLNELPPARLSKEDYLALFKKGKLKKHINYLRDEYKGKKVLLYGAGLLFEALCSYYDFSDINIIAVTDKRFSEEIELNGFRAVPPSMIKELKPDVIMVTLLNVYVAEDYLTREIYKNKKLPKIESLVSSEMFLLNS